MSEINWKFDMNEEEDMVHVYLNAGRTFKAVKQFFQKMGEVKPASATEPEMDYVSGQVEAFESLKDLLKENQVYQLFKEPKEEE